MKLKPNERAWAPEERPQYLVILRKDQSPPKTKEALLFLTQDLIVRLAKEANEREIVYANQCLRNLPESEQLWLPPEPMSKPEVTARGLMFNPAELGSPLHEWKSEIMEILDLPEMDPEILAEEVEGLSLESCLSRFV